MSNAFAHLFTHGNTARLVNLYTGDAVQARTAAMAIYEARKLAMTL